MSKNATAEQVRFLIETKVRKLQREQFSSVTYQQVEETLMNEKWQGEIPAHLTKVAADIAALSIQEVVDYITRDGAQQNLNFDSFVEGE